METIEFHEVKIGNYTFLMQLEGKILTIVAAPLPIEQLYGHSNIEIDMKNIEAYNWGKNEK